MPLQSVNAYLERLELRHTETKLLMADVTGLPHMKKRDRESVLKSWMRLLNIRGQTKSKPASPARLKMLGIGVRHE